MKTKLNSSATLAPAAASFTTITMAALLSLTPTAARAGTDIWTGGGIDGKWGTPANWQSGSPPAPNDSLIFTNTVRLSNTNNLLGISVSGITFATPSGGFNLWGNPVTLTGGLTNNQVVTLETINLPLTLASTPFVNVVPNASLSLTGAVSGASFGLNKVGGGLLTLAAANTFGGPLNVAGGTVTIFSDASLGAVPASATPGIIVLNGGTIQTTNAFAINTNRGIALGPLTGSGSGTFSIGTVAQGAGLTVSFGGVMANNGTNGGLTKLSFGGLTLFGKNTYTGPTAVKNGTLTLDFNQAASTITNNIINTNSSLTLGGATSGAGVTNWAALIVNPKAGSANTNSQTFNGTTIDLGQSFVRGNNNSSATVNINLGLLTNIPGGFVNFIAPTFVGGKGNITTSSTNVNGILAGWATVSDGSIPANRLPSAPTNYASVDANGNIVSFTNFTVFASSPMSSIMFVTNNILVNSNTSGDFQLAAANATPTFFDVNTISFDRNTPSWSFNIGSNNVLRLGKSGALFMRVNNGGNTCVIGNGAGGVAGAQSGAGTITAGGPNPNTAGQLIVINDTTGSASASNWNLDSQIADNGTGPVTLVKAGPGFLKLRNHNSYSGNTYVLQGRVQVDDTLTGGTPISDVFGTGDVYIFPGGNLFGGTSGGAPLPNRFFVAGASTQQEPQIGAIRTGTTLILTNLITLIGDTTIGGNGNLAGAIQGKITGPFNLSLCSGGTVNGPVSLSNPANDWSGNTIIQARNNTGNNIFLNGTSECIPDGFGKGNVSMLGYSTGTVQWDLHGFNETINGLSTSGNGPTCAISNGLASTTSLLTVGNNDQSGTFGGNIVAGGGTLALTKIGGGVLTLAGTNTYTGNTIVNGGTLALSGSGSVSNSPILVNSGATFDISGVTAPAFSTTNSLGLNGGTLIGNTAVAGIPSLGLTNAGLTVTLNAALTNLYCTSLTTDGPTNLINIIAVAGISSYPTQFTVIKYSGAIAGAGFNLGIGAVPSPTTQGYVSNDTANSRIVLVLNNGPKPLLWRGNVSRDWDIGTTTNWLAFNVSPAQFFNADSVTFDDTGLTNGVNLTTNTLPATVTVNNNVANYTFGGPGGISGFGTLLKQGSGSLTLTEAGPDDFHGGVTISGGTIIFAADNAISGGMVISAGTTAQVGTNGGTGTLPGGSVQDDSSIIVNRGADLAIPNNISGAGGISKLDVSVTTLSGANTFTGAVTVASGGTLRTGSGSALGVTNGTTTISSGATLDVNGQNLGGEPIIVSGTGVGGNGAIVNGGPDQINALQNVTLAADTTFGGTGRWDIRGTSSSLTAPGYSITKIGANQVSLVGAAVDTTLANINIQQGLFSIETTTSGAGAASGTITVSAGATLQLYNLGAVVDKNVVLNGDGVTTTLNIGNGTPNNISPSVGSMSLSGNCIVNLASGTALTLGGNSIGGTGSLTQTGGGTDTITANSTYPGGITNNGGALILNGINSGGGVLSINPGTVLAGVGANTGPVIINSASVLPGSSIPGPGVNLSGTLATGPLTLSNASYTADLQNGNSDLINVTGNLVLSGTNTITPAPVPAALSGNQQITIIAYTGSLTGTSNNLALAPSLPGYHFSLVDPATTPGAIKLSVDHVPDHKLWVGGAPTGPTNWDIGTTTNWLDQDLANAPAAFTAGDIAVFDDTSTTNLVNLVGVLDTTLIQMNNSLTNYTFAGAGKLTGIGELQLGGAGNLTIANSGSNDCTGPITINSGELIVGDGGTNGNLGSGVITNISSLAFNRSDAALRIPNIISSGIYSGIVSNIGPGTVALSGNNSGLFGQVYVAQGTLRTLNNRALGSTNLATTHVLSGATLDVGAVGANTINLGLTAIHLIGSGVTNGGALVNNSGSTAGGTNVANVFMDGDTSFGGTGRLDLRSDPINQNNASLSTAGAAYKLTKVGNNAFWISGVNVDLALGDIDVRNGTLGIETGTTLGDPNHILTVFSNATLNFFNLSNVLVKNLTLNDGATVASTSGTNTFGGAIALNGSNTFNVTSGDLALTNLFSSSGSAFVKTGANPLLLYFLPGSTVIDITAGVLDVTNTAGGTLSLASDQTLRGSGTLSGNLTTASGSTVAPGEPNALGRLTVVNGSVTLAGQTRINLNRVAATPNSVLSCAGGIALGGTLSATNIGAGILRSGDSFTVFTGPLSGSIAPALPPLWPGLSWNTATLNSAGNISVTGTVIPPQISGVQLSGNTVSLSGSGGLAGATYYVIESTNVTLPLIQWTRIATNTFGPGGSFSYSGTPNVPALPNAYFTIQVP